MKLDMKKTGRILLLVVFLLLAGYQLVCSVTLLIVFKDNQTAMWYLIKGLLAAVLYIGLFYSKELIDLRTKNKQKELLTEPITETAMHQAMASVEAALPEEATKMQEDIHPAAQDAAVVQSHESSFKEKNVYLIPCLLSMILIESAGLLISYAIFSQSIFFIILISSLTLAALIFAATFLPAKPTAFAQHFLDKQQELQAITQEDALSERLYQLAIRKRYQAAVMMACCSIILFFTIMLLTLYWRVPFLLSLCIMVVLELGMIFLRSMQVKQADEQLIKAINDGYSVSVLAMLLKLYAQKSKILKPLFNVHTFVILALYEVEHYALAAELIPFIKVKGKTYQLYNNSLLLLCQQGLQDRQAMIQTISTLDGLLSKTSRKENDVLKRSRFIYELVIAYVDDKEEEITRLVEVSQGMSPIYQRAAKKILLHSEH